MPASTLNGAIDDAVTTIIVMDATGFPTPNFRIQVEDELMLVTQVTSNTFTVTRGDLQTPAASHVDGTAVTYVVSSDISSDTISTY